jgi:DNA-binding NtrC family response regulator
MADRKEKLKILVVDDDEDLRELIVQIFDSAEFETFSAKNGREAFRIFETTKLDVVLSDVRMPEMDGVNLLKRIKEKNNILPVVFLITGYSDLNPEEAKKYGAVGLVTKPFDRDSLMIAIEKAIGESKKHSPRAG